jgi:hypothetical protein
LARVDRRGLVRDQVSLIEGLTTVLVQAIRREKPLGGEGLRDQ